LENYGDVINFLFFEMSNFEEKYYILRKSYFWILENMEMLFENYWSIFEK
jgi:hypothetical protein